MRAGAVAETKQLGWWHVSAQARYVPKLRGALRSAIRGRGFNDAEIALAVTEALSNVVQHAYPDGGGPMTLSAEVSSSDLTVVVSDQGSGARIIPSNPAAEPGIGLGLIRHLSHQLEIEPAGDGTTVTMRFLPTRARLADRDQSA